jgi:hypothetical protein
MPRDWTRISLGLLDDYPAGQRRLEVPGQHIAVPEDLCLGQCDVCHIGQTAMISADLRGEVRARPVSFAGVAARVAACGGCWRPGRG